MNRMIKMDSHLLCSNKEVVIELKVDSIDKILIEFFLLINGECSSVLFVFPDCFKVKLEISTSIARGEKVMISRQKSRVKALLNLDHMGYLANTMLRAYRDQIAEVDHIHLEGNTENERFDLTFLFDKTSEPTPFDQIEEFLD